MIKIGIMTLVGSDNCGSLLQTYALQTYLENNFDCKVEVINYRDEVSARTYGIFAPAIIMRPIQLIRTIQYYKRLKRQQTDYQNFRSGELHLTEKIYHNIQELQNEKWNYDILITGSDQVWNWPEAYIDETYFLDWGGENVRRIAYAPSTGGSINPDNSLLEWVNNDAEVLKKIRACLTRFQMISVREESGQQYLQRLLGKEIPLVADPTLMLEKKYWDELAGPRIVDGDYIFYYSYGYKNDELNTLVSIAADKLKLPVYVINASLWNHKNDKKLKFNIHGNGGPYAYLSLMKHAKYVFAESFHGCIFAFIFKKNFWFMNNFSDGRLEARISSLLEYLELKDRVLHVENFESCDLELPINYLKTFGKFDGLRAISQQYLERAITTDYSTDFVEESIEYQVAINTIWSEINKDEIETKISDIKPLAFQVADNISDLAFEQYFNVSKQDIFTLSNAELLNKIINSRLFKQQEEYKKIKERYGYLGHLLFRTKQKFEEGGMKSVFKAIIVKYKWWFRIGY